MPFEQTAHQFAVAYVSLLEDVACISRERLQVTRISSVGQLVQIDDRSSLAIHPLQNEIRADETSSAGDQDCLLHAK